jgi:hypothetical protein
MDALPIPKPQVLDPHRLLVNDEDDFTANHEARAALLQRALETSCSYADQLWDDLNAMRQYLLDCLPPDPHTTTGLVATGAAPTGPDDEQGWQNWMNAFAAVTSVLCGPHGDSGFGLSRARQEAQLRRDVPVSPARPSATPDAPRPAPGTTPDAATRMVTPSPTPGAEPAVNEGTRSPNRSPGTRHLLRPVATAVLIVLALRGLRPRRAIPTDRAALHGDG